MARNPHLKYGRSDKRGFVLMDVTPEATVTRFMGLDDVRDPKSKIATLATFEVADGKAGLRQSS